MAALAVNLLALLMVLGLCWAAMMWLSGGFHGHTVTTVEIDGIADLTLPAFSDEPCEVCEGVGAHNDHGRVAPCPQCFGTGVLT